VPCCWRGGVIPLLLGRKNAWLLDMASGVDRGSSNLSVERTSLHFIKRWLFSCKESKYMAFRMEEFMV